MQTIQLGEIINATLKSEEKCKQYRLKDILGIGTGGIVYEAQNIWDENDIIAIKKEKEVLQHTLDLYKVMEEKRLDNVVNVLFVKEDYGKSYFIGMEKADGSVTELYEQVKREKISQEKQIEFIDDMIKQIANGIYSIHANQIIHRDLKPDNIVYKKNGDKIQYMICDLGLAKQNKDKQEEEYYKVKSTSGVGTPLYMAPEIFDTNSDYDSSVDIWAFGVMIYELFANLELTADQELFSGKSVQQVQYQIQKYKEEDLTQKLQKLQLMPLTYKYLLEGMIVRISAQRKDIKQILEYLDSRKWNKLSKNMVLPYSFLNGIFSKGVFILKF